MRHRFSLTFILAIIALSVFGVSAQTDWEAANKQKRKQTTVRSIQKQNGVIVTTFNQSVVRSAPRVVVRPVVPRTPGAVVRANVRFSESSYSANRNSRNYSDRSYESRGDYEDGRAFESNRNGSVAEVARLNGYRDGVREGIRDARDGEAYNPFGEHAYKDGATGYISKYRNREAYQQVYRQSFVRGYKESFDRYLGNYDRRNW